MEEQQINRLNISKTVLLFVLILQTSVRCKASEEVPESKNSNNTRTEEESSQENQKNLLKEFSSNSSKLLCYSIYPKIPPKYLREKSAPLLDLLTDKSSEPKYFEKYIFTAIDNCIKKSKKLKEKELREDINSLFEKKNTWFNITRKYYLFNDDIYLEKNITLGKELTELRNDYAKIMQAVQVS